PAEMPAVSVVALVGSIQGETKTGRFLQAAPMDAKRLPKGPLTLAMNHFPCRGSPDRPRRPQTRKPNKTGVPYQFLSRAQFPISSGKRQSFIGNSSPP